MGYKNKKSLVKQIEENLTNKLAIGESKHQAKRTEEGIKGKIYSYNTLKNYMQHANYFAQYCKENHNCKTLAQCRSYVDEWLKSRENLSSYTLKMEACALAKLYDCSTTDFIKTKSRSRSDITRSRNDVENDKHFNEEKHKDFVEFCKSTGLRREELKYLTGDKLVYRNGEPYVIVDKGAKGGRYREAPVRGNIELVEKKMQEAGTNKVFEKIPSHADIHSYRADYATAYYKEIARDIKDIPFDKINKGSGFKYQSEVYCCRSDKQGIKYDKVAMKQVTEALGHSRIDVIADHYLHI